MNESANIFFAIGIGYLTADVVTRSRYSLSLQKQKDLLIEAKRLSISDVMILSTCNRTEIIGIADNKEVLINLLCKYSLGSVEDFKKHSYIYQKDKAVEHIIRLATGIDSQILGDYEIVGQLKTAFNNSKEVGVISVFLERLFNISLQASKEVKNKTLLSSGTTSVSYATIQYIKENISNYSELSVLIIGIGKMGESTAKNAVKHFEGNRIVLMNRNVHKSKELSQELGVNYSDFENLNSELKKADIVVVATSASKSLVTSNNVNNSKQQYYFDLSVPKNVSEDVSEVDNITVIDVDKLSSKTDTTIANRKEQVPLAMEIVSKYKNDFLDWQSFRKITPTINHLKKSLEKLQNDALNIYSNDGSDRGKGEEITSYLIDKIVSKYAVYLKENSNKQTEELLQVEEVFK